MTSEALAHTNASCKNNNFLPINQFFTLSVRSLKEFNYYLVTLYEGDDDLLSHSE